MTSIKIGESEVGDISTMGEPVPQDQLDAYIESVETEVLSELEKMRRERAVDEGRLLG